MIESLVVASLLATSVPAESPNDEERTEFPDESAVLVEAINFEDTDDSEEDFLKLV